MLWGIAMANYYETLGVDPSADAKAIRQAYRRLARQHHPDVNSGDPESAERFKAINAAYEVLSDADKRAKYDRYGEQWERAEQFEQAGGAGGFTGFGPFFHGGDAGGDYGGGRGGGFTFTTGGGESLADLLGGMAGGFAGGIGERFRSRPADIPVEITLEEADRGTTRQLNLPDGRRLEVSVPAGIADGGRVHIAAGGRAGSDFNLVVSILPHARFERQGADLYSTIETPLLDAVLGGTVKVKTLRGQVELTLPPATQNGRRFRLAGQGLSQLRAPERRGDLFATVSVALPRSLTAEQRALFEQLRDAGLSAGLSSESPAQ